MIRALGFAVFLFPAVALADDVGAPLDHMDHGQMMHIHQSAAAGPTQPGQGAFAAIQEIVDILEADPKTDWSKVNIEGLRQHLIDMDNVTLRASVKSESVDGGVRFAVTGEGGVSDSIRRMVMAHCAIMKGVGGWLFEASEIEGGATLTVLAPAKDGDKLGGLGFLGILTRGMHHQEHHMMIARGLVPYAHQ